MAAALLCLLTFPGLAKVRVIYGDSLELDGETIRINGIDAPEAGQTCATRLGSEWPCGREAVAAIAALVERN